MGSLGAILIADDDDTFRQATVELLCRESYDCEGAADAATAAEMMRGTEYDLLIADIRMPGNDNLALVRSLPQIAPGMPAILITAYPSVDSAVDSIHLPVVAYLTKPFPLEELLERVREALERSGAGRCMERILRGLRAAGEDCQQLQSRLRGVRQELPQEELGRELRSVIRTLAECIGEARHLLQTRAPHQEGESLCSLVACQRWRILQQALGDAIEVVERTKRAFKSKELAELRLRLERALADAEKTT